MSTQKMPGLSANVKTQGPSSGVKPAPKMIKDKVEGKQGNSSKGATGLIHDYTTPAGKVRAGGVHSVKMPGLSSNSGSKQGKSAAY